MKLQAGFRAQGQDVNGSEGLGLGIRVQGLRVPKP